MACRLTGAKPLSEPMLEFDNWTLGNKFQWNLNQNSCIFIQENPFENVVWKMAAILSLLIYKTRDVTRKCDRNMCPRCQKLSDAWYNLQFVYFVCLIHYQVISDLIHFRHLYLLYQPHLGLCQAQCVQSHPRQPMSAVAITTCEVQVSAAEFQTVPTVATGVWP